MDSWAIGLKRLTGLNVDKDDGCGVLVLLEELLKSLLIMIDGRFTGLFTETKWMWYWLALMPKRFVEIHR